MSKRTKKKNQKHKAKLCAIKLSVQKRRSEAIAYLQSGLFAKAGELLEKLMAKEPSNDDFIYLLAVVAIQMGDHDKASELLQRTIEVNPGHANAHYNLGIIQQKGEKTTEAIAHYQKVLDIDPNRIDARNNLGSLYMRIGCIDLALENFSKSVSFLPGFELTYSNVLLLYNYFPDFTKADTYHKHLSLTQHLNELTGSRGGHLFSGRAANSKLRVGYVSPDFRKHSVAYFVEPLLKRHDKSLLEIYCYNNNSDKSDDVVTERFKCYADKWRSVSGLGDQQFFALIRQDNIDILVDLSGHTEGNRLSLFALKPAPIQVSWLGYPNTTGLKSMDYRFTDEVADPSGGSELFYSEQLIRLPYGFLCYEGDRSIEVLSFEKERENAYITFGSFNALPKITDQVLTLWVSILNNLTESHIILKSQKFIDVNVQTRFFQLFEQEGISRDRIHLYGYLPQKEHMDLYNEIDVALDTFPYNGTTTTCEALWMGVPTISLRGDRHVSRVGASILTRLGLEEFIVEDEAAYVDLAVTLANNREYLFQVKKRLRSRMQNSKLCDALSFAQSIEKEYFNMWERYHEGQQKPCDVGILSEKVSDEGVTILG